MCVCHDFIVIENVIHGIIIDEVCKYLSHFTDILNVLMNKLISCLLLLYVMKIMFNQNKDHESFQKCYLCIHYIHKSW